MPGHDSVDGAPVTETFELLSDPLRRSAFREVVDRDGPVGLDELSDAVRERTERADAPVEVSDGGYDDEVTSLLHHVHLPKLSRANWIEYDSDGCVIEAAPVGGDVHTSLLAAAEDLEALCARLAADADTTPDDAS